MKIMSRRIELINEIVARNECHIRVKNKIASVSRNPMPEEERKQCYELRKANIWLRKAEFCISQALSGDKGFIDTNPSKKPILAIRCHKCGNVYMGVALGFLISDDTAKRIKQAVDNGDELYISDTVTLQMCKCND